MTTISTSEPKKPSAFAWGKPPIVQVTNERKKTLAEIMAEESETLLAAKAVYPNDITLAEMEAEQERLLRSFQDTKPKVPQIQLPPPSYLTKTADSFSHRALEEIEQSVAGIVIDGPNSNGADQERRRYSALEASPQLAPIQRQEQPPTKTKTNDFPKDLLEGARNHLSEQEMEEIERALREADLGDISSTESHMLSPVSTVASRSIKTKEEESFLSEEEAAAIAAALRDADAKQEEESLMLALQMQQQELGQLQKESSMRKHPQGNVRSMTRAELETESQRVAKLYEDRRTEGDALGLVAGALGCRTNKPGMEDYDNVHVVDESAGFRMNSASEQEWVRRDRNTIVGPNNEIRTKHDVHVQGQANAQYLGLEEDDYGIRAHVGNQAFNSFKKNMKRTTKGVATHGTGRAGTDSDAVRGKAMDPHVRLQISKAINSGLIEHCNGAVKQGKEAVIYHAEQGAESQGHDVAVKVFKRITEFRGRGAYVDGDPRYLGQSFRNNSEREQLELWAEKEFRNLVRANRSKVPVPTPLQVKENIIFMRFMGNDGWAAPQIREIEMSKGNKRWQILYTQVMEAIRR